MPIMKSFINIFTRSNKKNSPKKAKRIEKFSPQSATSKDGSFSSSTTTISSKDFDTATEACVIENYFESPTSANPEGDLSFDGYQRKMKESLKKRSKFMKRAKDNIFQSMISDPLPDPLTNVKHLKHIKSMKAQSFNHGNKEKLLTYDNWVSLLDENEMDKVDIRTLKNSLRNGIPSELRGRIWAFLIKSNVDASNFNESIYRKLLSVSNEEVDNAIARDLKRTFPQLNMFMDDHKEGNNKLFNLLKAYAALDDSVEYCQGMNYVAGLILLNIPDENIAFWTFVKIMQDKEWRNVYVEGTPKLLSMLGVLKMQIKKNFPRIQKHMDQKEIIMESTFSQVFLTLSIYNSPIEVASRIFDMFLLEGEKILFRVVLRMLELKEDKILSLDTMELHQYLRGEMMKECTEEYSIISLIMPN